MRRFLLASAAAASLAFAAQAYAQTPEPVPPTPPVTTPAPDPDVTEDERIGTTGQQPTPIPETPVPDAPQAATPMTAAPASAAAICAPRTTAVNFGRSTALNRDNSNIIERAVDAASVCDLQQVVIAGAGQGSVAARRASAVRALLVRQGVPADQISVQQDADAEAGEVEVRMMFAGVAQSATLTPPAQPDAAAPSTDIPGQPDAEEDKDTPADT